MEFVACSLSEQQQQYSSQLQRRIVSKSAYSGHVLTAQLGHPKPTPSFVLRAIMFCRDEPGANKYSSLFRATPPVIDFFPTHDEREHGHMAGGRLSPQVTVVERCSGFAVGFIQMRCRTVRVRTRSCELY